MNKSKVLEELFKEIIKIVEHCEKNKKENHSYWFYYYDERKYSRARFKRLRLTIDEMLKDIEREGKQTMKQYCRYCSHMICGDANYCEAYHKCFTDEKIKRVNKCKKFSFNEIDALTFNKYNPRKNKKNYEQTSINLEEDE